MTSAVALVGADLKHPQVPADPERVAIRRPLGTGAFAFDDVRVAALAHEPWACRQLYDDYAGRVLGYLRAQGAPEPEDLTSEVFLRVFDRLGQFAGDEPNFRSWLFTIAHRIVIDDAAPAAASPADHLARHRRRVAHHGRRRARSARQRGCGVGRRAARLACLPTSGRWSPSASPPTCHSSRSRRSSASESGP